MYSTETMVVLKPDTLKQMINDLKHSTETMVVLKQRISHFVSLLHCWFHRNNGCIETCLFEYKQLQLQDSTETMVVLKLFSFFISKVPTFFNSTETMVVLKQLLIMYLKLEKSHSTETMVVLKHAELKAKAYADTAFHRNNGCIETTS